MACYHPTQAWVLKGQRKTNGALITSFRPPSKDQEELWENIQVPCKKCLGCKLDYSRDWANRIVLESTLWEHNWFLTLTYDEEHVPLSSTINTTTGELIEGKTLVPEHVKTFMKDLRRYWSYHYDHNNIRFFACGEYGGQTERPHYHICVFNLPIFDLEPFFLNSQHQQVYKSESIRKVWKKGNISVGELTWSSAAYTARYMLKKQTGKGAAWYYKSKGQKPEFTQMSLKPGIAYGYYVKHKEEIYKNDEIVITRNNKGQTIRPPKYFDTHYMAEEPEKMQAIKEERARVAKLREKSAEAQSSMWPWERLKVQEKAKEKQVKRLRRVLEV